MSLTNNTLSENQFGDSISAENVQSLLRGSRSCFLSCLKFVQSDLNLPKCIPYMRFAISEDIDEILQLVVPLAWKNAKYLVYQPDFLEIRYLLKPAFSNVDSIFQHGLQFGLLSDMLLSVYTWMAIDPLVRVNDFIKILDDYCLDFVDKGVLEKIRMDPTLEKNGSESSLPRTFHKRNLIGGNCRDEHVSISNVDKECNQQRTQKRGTRKPNISQVGCSYLEYEPRPKRYSADEFASVYTDGNGILEIDLSDDYEESARSKRRVVDTPTSASSRKMYFMSGIFKRRLLANDLQVERIVTFPFNDSCAGLVYHTDYILAICSSISSGLQSNDQTTPIIRYLNLKDKVWRIGPPMILPRYQFGWVFGNDSLYVVGGESPYHISQVCCSNTLYELDLQTKEWTRKATMQSGRIGVSIVSFESRLFAIGGGSHFAQYGIECEVYNPESNTWSSISKLNRPRRNAGTFVFDRNIYVVGGNQGFPTVETYNESDSIWKLLENRKLPFFANCKSVAFSG
ncbi:unnamed protein product [Allacma fusca]|uniref:BACK domain-containing protein n=1 Tax=Allacma fusca TaxID=39272 RepID=A0A8J2JVW0_9HEXA|nr:unnamed protein product [Allacma fusca]